MASLLPPIAVPKRNPRRVAHGGLGGCVQTGQEDRFYETYNRKMSLSRRPLRGKKGPLAVNINAEDRDIALSTMTPTSVVLHDDSSYGEFGNPFADQMKAPPLDENSVELVSPIEQHESGRHSPVFVNRPQTPPTPEQTATLPVELPGSILLPSQGFPQTNPPVAPARDIFKTFASDDSRRSSTPSLDSSSSTTDSDMDMLKNLTSPSKRSGRANTFPAPQVIKASKPIQAMSADELMKCLPELNMSIISHSWVPAMENELKRIKALLQEAAEVQVQNQADLGNFGSDVNSIAVSARNISRTYLDAMQRVGPLADRDAKAITDQLEAAQADLRVALAAVEEKNNIISDNENLIQALRETITANTRTLGGFIQAHVGSRLNNLRDIRTEEVKQLLEDYQPTSSGSEARTPCSYVRIPEQHYTTHLQTLHDAQQKVETYSKIAHDQLELIKSQSADLDKRIEGYGECLAMLEKRDSRIVELESKIGAIEKELKEAKETVEAYCILKQEHENLGQHCKDLDWTLQSIKDGCQKQMEDRDTEIFTLRQQLGDAVMEIAAHKTEAKAAIPQSGSASLASRFRNPLHLGRHATAQDRNLPINARRARSSGKVPTSQSMLSLNTSEANLIPTKLSIHRSQNTPSPLSDTTRQSVESSSDQGSSSGNRRWLSGLRLHPPNTAPLTLGSSVPELRARKEYLSTKRKPARTTEVLEGEGARPSSVLVDCEKALPCPPACESQDFQLHNENKDQDEEEDGSKMQKENNTPHSPSAAVPLHRSPLTVSPLKLSPANRRVLSGITERSIEDATSPDSTTSSDKNIFRSSMAMLEKFDEMDGDEPNTPSSAGQAGVFHYGRRTGDEMNSPVRSSRDVREAYSHTLTRVGRARRGRAGGRGFRG